jgi:hypothetical protein
VSDVPAHATTAATAGADAPAEALRAPTTAVIRESSSTREVASVAEAPPMAMGPGVEQAPPAATPIEAGMMALAVGAGSIASHPHSRAFMDRVEAFLGRMTVGNSVWQWISSRIWLPIAFKSGIRFKKIDAETFHAVLPFKRFNRNWYNAMAGASLLANSEIAGGMYLWGRLGGDYTVVCKSLSYRFLRPCFGPALYRVKPKQDLDTLVKGGGEFNIDIDLDVVQQIVPGKHDVERRVGVSHATFHITPKAHHKRKRERRKARAARR